MKKLFLLIPIIGFFACNVQTGTEEPDYSAMISGTIENAKADFVVLRYSEQSDTATLDTNGYFMLRIDSLKTGYCTFYHPNESATIFLIPGDSIYLTLNIEEFDESLTFSGKGEEINNYLISIFLLKEKLNINPRELYALERDEFIVKTDSIKTTLNNHFEEFFNSKDSINETFVKLEKAKLLYSWANHRSKYLQWHKYLTKKDSVDLGEDYDSYLAELNLNDSNLIEVREYASFLKSYLDKLAPEEFKKDSTLKGIKHSYLIAKLRVIPNTFTDQKVKDYLLYSTMNDQIRYSGFKGIDSLIAEFNKNCSDAEYKSKFKEEYEKWKLLADGMPAPGFSYTDIDSNLVSLSDFKGKYVYIDVWATWCGPCIMEIPHLEELEEEYKDKNIVFISVSIDNTRDPWKKMVHEKEMKGVQLFAEGAWKSSIVKDYNIRGIPRFILIDREGKIIDVKAPRPSGNIKEVLEELEGIEA